MTDLEKSMEDYLEAKENLRVAEEKEWRGSKEDFMIGVNSRDVFYKTVKYEEAKELADGLLRAAVTSNGRSLITLKNKDEK